MATGLVDLKTASKKVAHKAAEVTDEYIGNKIADAVARSNNNKIEKTKYVIDENSRELLRK